MSRWRSRRGLLPGIALLALLLTACPDPEGPPPGSEPERGGPSVDVPSPGGTIRFGLLGEPATLDPYDERASDLTRSIARVIYPSLFRLVPEGTAEPFLAAGLEVEGRRATVRLVGSVSWSDGSPLTSRDVVASWRRARSTRGPSGFRDIDRASSLDPNTVVFIGDVDDWETTLARAAYVKPAEPDSKLTAGPYRLAGRTPGLEVVLEPDPLWFGEHAASSPIRVRFIRTTQTMLDLLDRGELDVAAVPSTVNLAERLEGSDLAVDAALGWETIALRFGGGLSREERAGFVDVLNVEALEEILIRDDGERVTTLHPGPRRSSGPYASLGPGREPAGEVTVTSPAGDDLLTLLLRGIYAQLDRAGVVAEAAPIDPFIFYGEWLETDPSDVSIRRVAGAPGSHEPPDDTAALGHFPLFRVTTYLVWRPDVEGPEANPTLDGPLWNAHRWAPTPGS